MHSALKDLRTASVSNLTLSAASKQARPYAITATAAVADETWVIRQNAINIISSLAS